MSNDTQAVETAVVAKPTKASRARKAKKSEKAVKAKAPAASSNGKLLKPHRQVLGTLAKAKGPLSRRAIAERVGRTENLIEGRIAAETKTYGALEASGFIRVKTFDIDGKTETVNELTAAGRKALAASK